MIPDTTITSRCIKVVTEDLLRSKIRYIYIKNLTKFHFFFTTEQAQWQLTSSQSLDEIGNYLPTLAFFE